MREISLEHPTDRPLCLALGFFDSVHAGHRALLAVARAEAAARGCESAVVTFSNNAYRRFNPDGKLIYTYPERKRLFEALGMQNVLPFRFDKQLKQIDKETFLNRLTDRLDVRCFVCGYDYLFGAGGAGDAAYLAQYAAAKGIACRVLDPVMLDGQRVSSSLIKRLLLCGEVAQANRFLVDRFSLRGEVERGRGIGHLFGIPTQNVRPGKEKLLPKSGVYATYNEVDGVSYRSVTNVGDKPTFAEPSVTVESLLDGYEGDAYGKTVTVRFVRALRPIRKFDSPQALAAQIHRDLQWSETV